jgi:hypothetical protein
MTSPILSLSLGRDSNEQSLGALITFLVSHDLLAPQLMSQHGSACARVKMQDLRGSEFLTTVLVGDLRSEHLSEAGLAFCKNYVTSGRFADDLASIGVAENEWILFDRLSARMMSVLKPKAPESIAQSAKQVVAKVLQFPGRPRS